MKYALALATSCLLLTGCGLFFGGDDDGVDGGHNFPPDADPNAPDAAPRVDAAPIVDGGACSPTVRQFAPLPSPHVAEGSSVSYAENPPMSGPHYPVWARWNVTYGPGVLARPYWVHNLEHGAVVFLFNCPQAGGCPDVVASLEALQSSLPADPLCNGIDPSVRTRTLVVADALLPAGVQVAASAWGFTYTASCFDQASLRSFYDDHFGHASEDLCGQGSRP